MSRMCSRNGCEATAALSSTSLRCFFRSFFERAINRPRRAENLESGKPKTVRLVFDQHLSDAQHLRQLRCVDQRCWLIAGKAAMEGERRARRSGTRAFAPPGWLV